LLDSILKRAANVRNRKAISDLEMVGFWDFFCSKIKSYSSSQLSFVFPDPEAGNVEIILIACLPRNHKTNKYLYQQFANAVCKMALISPARFITIKCPPFDIICVGVVNRMGNTSSCEP